MAIWKDARVTFNGQNISGQVRAAALEFAADTPEATAMGDDTRIMAAGGLKNWSCELELNWAAGSTTSVDSLFGSTAGVGQSAAFTIRPTTGAIAAGNPEYSGTAVVSSYSPFPGPVGDQHVANVSLVAGGTLSRAIST